MTDNRQSTKQEKYFKFSTISDNGVTVWPCWFRPGFLQPQNVQKNSPCQFRPHLSNVFSKGWCLHWQHQLYQTMHLLQEVPFIVLMKMAASPHTKPAPVLMSHGSHSAQEHHKGRRCH